MILPFKPQFRAPILDGTKIHTIREDKHRRWKKGRIIHMATSVRTKFYDCFKIEECKSIQAIDIFYNDPKDSPIIKVDGKVLNRAEKLELARKDGFNTMIDFYCWFNDNFTGRIIHWTEKRY